MPREPETSEVLLFAVDTDIIACSHNPSDFKSDFLNVHGCLASNSFKLKKIKTTLLTFDHKTEAANLTIAVKSFFFRKNV